MKKLVFFLFFLISACLRAQSNLVIDGSFEDYHTCPNNGGLTFLNHWFDPTGLSSDYFNSCSGNLGVPVNGAGYQPARSGNGYTGLFAVTMNTGPNSDGHEYIETKLTTPLKNGHKYSIEFYVNLATISDCAVDGMSAFLSNDCTVTPNVVLHLYLDAQINNPSNNILKDTLGWMKVGGVYDSQGGEQFLTIGNFTKNIENNVDSNFQKNTPPSYSRWAYYYVDDVSVICIDCDSTAPANNFFIPDAFSPNGDGNNDKLFVRGNNIQELYFAVYDRWGEKVFETTDKNNGWDGTYKGSTLSGAVFVYYCKGKYTDGLEFKQKGDITLVR